MWTSPTASSTPPSGLSRQFVGTAHGELQVPVACQPEGGGGIGRRGATGDDRRPAIGSGVPDPPGRVEVGITGGDDLTLELRAQPLHVTHRCHRPPLLDPDRGDRRRYIGGIDLETGGDAPGPLTSPSLTVR
jgi:hypothetical protein